MGLGYACYIKVTFGGWLVLYYHVWCCFRVLIVDRLLLIVLLSFLYFFLVGLLCGMCLCLVFCCDVGCLLLVHCRLVG